MTYIILTNPLRMYFKNQVRNRVFEQADNFICRDWLNNTMLELCSAFLLSVKPSVTPAVVNLEQFYSLKIKRTWKIWI